jgi:hypothetical protein
METPNYEKIGIVEKLRRVGCSTLNQSTEIEVKNLDHLGLVAGIIDEIGIVEIINEQVSMGSRRNCHSWASRASNYPEPIGICLPILVFISSIF